MDVFFHLLENKKKSLEETFTCACSYRKRKSDEVDGVSKKQKKEEEEEKKKLDDQLKVPLYMSPFYFTFWNKCQIICGIHALNMWLSFFVCVYMRPQNQSQLIWGIKDKLRKFCSINDMKELLIANGQEVPSGESNVREPQLISFFRSDFNVCGLLDHITVYSH